MVCNNGEERKPDVMPELAHSPHNCPQLTVKSGPAPLCLIQLHIFPLGDWEGQHVWQNCVQSACNMSIGPQMPRDNVTQENHMISGEMAFSFSPAALILEHTSPRLLKENHHLLASDTFKFSIFFSAPLSCLISCKPCDMYFCTYTGSIRFQLFTSSGTWCLD